MLNNLHFYISNNLRKENTTFTYYIMKRREIFATLVALLLIVGCTQPPRTFTNEEITNAWHKGLTLPVDASKQFPPKPVTPKNDN